MWQIFVLTLLNFGYISTFNVDTNSPIILSTDSAKGLFGHSISILENDDVIIGAPESETHGNVFLCRNVKDPNPITCDKLGKLVFQWNHVSGIGYILISVTDLTSDYKYFLGARLAKDDDKVKTCGFRAPYRKDYRYNLKTKCYDVNMSKERLETFLEYDYNKIVPYNDIRYGMY